MNGIAQPARATAAVVRAALACLIGPMIWGLHLGLVYAAHHLSCRASADAGALAPIVIGATALALISLGLAAARPQRLIESKRAAIEPSLRAFLAVVTRWLILLSVFGVIWTSSALLFVTACAV